MMKAAVSEGSAQPFMKEEKEQGDLNSFRGEAVGVVGSVTLQQGMAFELAQIVAHLSEDGLVDPAGSSLARRHPRRRLDGQGQKALRD